MRVLNVLIAQENDQSLPDYKAVIVYLANDQRYRQLMESLFYVLFFGLCGNTGFFHSGILVPYYTFCRR